MRGHCRSEAAAGSRRQAAVALDILAAGLQHHAAAKAGWVVGQLQLQCLPAGQVCLYITAGLQGGMVSQGQAQSCGACLEVGWHAQSGVVMQSALRPEWAQTHRNSAYTRVSKFNACVACHILLGGIGDGPNV